MKIKIRTKILAEYLSITILMVIVGYYTKDQIIIGLILAAIAGIGLGTYSSMTLSKLMTGLVSVDRITTELQDEVMQMRLVPVEVKK